MFTTSGGGSRNNYKKVLNKKWNLTKNHRLRLANLPRNSALVFVILGAFAAFLQVGCIRANAATTATASATATTSYRGTIYQEWSFSVDTDYPPGCTAPADAVTYGYLCAAGEIESAMRGAPGSYDGMTCPSAYLGSLTTSISDYGPTWWSGGGSGTCIWPGHNYGPYYGYGVQLDAAWKCPEGGAYYSQYPGWCIINGQAPPLKDFERSRNYGKQTCSCMSGDPINVGNGNVYESVTDYKARNKFGLIVNRFYNSESPAEGLFGYGWSSNLNRHITVQKNYSPPGTSPSATYSITRVSVYRPNGSIDYFW